jgi:methyl-accepting chemotaxis protein
MLKTLKAKIVFGCLTAVVITTGIGLNSLYVKDRLISDLQETNTISVALRNHTIGDMVHDGLRSVVLSSLTAQELGTKKEDVEKDLSEMVATISRVISENKALALPDDVRSALDGVKQPLADYIASAQKIVGHSFSNRPDALAAMPEFSERFEALETALEQVGDRIQDSAKTIGETSAAFAEVGTYISTSALLIGVLVTSALMWFMLRGMIAPLQILREAMMALANGNEQAEIVGLDRADEIGDMAQTLRVFQTNAVEAKRMRQEQTQSEARAKNLRRKELMQLTQTFETAVGGAWRPCRRLLPILNILPRPYRARLQRRANLRPRCRARRLAPRPTCILSLRHPRNWRRRSARSRGRSMTRLRWRARPGRRWKGPITAWCSCRHRLNASATS